MLNPGSQARPLSAMDRPLPADLSAYRKARAIGSTELSRSGLSGWQGGRGRACGGVAAEIARFLSAEPDELGTTATPTLERAAPGHGSWYETAPIGADPYHDPQKPAPSLHTGADRPAKHRGHCGQTRTLTLTLEGL
ncbi:hypothetical protein Psuf_072720 [Phytohabitans suffuscus]|uniref:Uncharacterized protein n=1 Tax=Phytohabitans suffuscus TaxID=624315 RepID=A0A6F8YV56_9ACTN|nr:hypothetical protein Psuf_072720 [Phytohabitans suffuscus]